MIFLPACALLIHFRPCPTFAEARLHLQANQGRSPARSSIAVVKQSGISCLAKLILFGCLRVSPPVLDIKNLNDVLLNKGHKQHCACESIKSLCFWMVWLSY